MKGKIINIESDEGVIQSLIKIKIMRDTVKEELKYG